MPCLRWLRSTSAAFTSARRNFSSSDIPWLPAAKGFEDHSFEAWQTLSSPGNSNKDFLSQASDKSHPLIKGISKLLETSQPGNPGFATSDLQKIYNKKNNPTLLSLQRQRRMKRKQADEMKPTQYLFLMSQWIKKGGAKIGQPMFEQMLKVGVEPVDAYATMIKHFISRAKAALTSEDVDEGSREEEANKCVFEGLKYLHEMREKGIAPNGSTYEPLVSWFVENDKAAEFDEILEWIKTDGLSCYTGVFKSFGALGRHEDAYKHFTLVKEMDVSEELLSDYLTAYVRGVASSPKVEFLSMVDETLKLFRHVIEKFNLTPVYDTYSALVNVSCRGGQIHQALDLIQEMHERGLELSSELFHPLLLLFVQGQQPQGAFESFAAMQRMGVQPSFETYNFLIRAATKANKLETIFALLGEMKELGIKRTAETYNAIIQALGSAKQFAKALTLLHEMERDNVKPDYVTYMELICASPDSKVAFEMFQKMKTQGMKPTDGVYSYLFSAMVKDGELDQAIQMLGDPEASFRIGISAKSALLSGLANEHRLEEALVCFEDIKADGGKFPDPYAYGHLIGALGYSGNLDRMFELFDMAIKGGMWPKRTDPSLEEQKVYWCMYVTKACVLHNDLRRLESFLQKAKEMDYGGDESVIFDTIILEIAGGGGNIPGGLAWSWADGFSLLDVMHKLEIPPSRTFLEALLDGCVVLKDADRAERILEEIQRAGLQLNVLTLIRLLRVYVVVKNVEKAASVLSRMKDSLKDEDVFLLVGEILNAAGPSLQESVFKKLELSKTFL